MRGNTIKYALPWDLVCPWLESKPWLGFQGLKGHRVASFVADRKRLRTYEKTSFSSHSRRLALETRTTQGETQGERQEIKG